MRLVPALALLLTACATSAAAGDAGTPLGRTARVAGVAVTPLSVLEDSRCPADVLCAWAGQVRIAARVAGAGRKELTLGKPAAIGGGRTLTLQSVTPERRKQGRPIAPGAYRFTFAIGKAG